jgi:tripartite-type tricarboxylate transporter receptor subunit TctC
MNRRDTVIALLSLGTAPLGSFAQQTAKPDVIGFPTKPVRIIIPNISGSPVDLRSRQIAAKFPEVFGQPLIVESRPGANGFIAAQVVADASGDGYTLLNGTQNEIVLNQWLFRNLPYRPEADFIPVVSISRGPTILAVNAQLPAQNLKEYLALAKARAGQLTYGCVPKALGFLVMEQIKSKTGVDILQIPYKAFGAELPDLLSGQVSSSFSYWSVLMPHVKAGKLRMLAVASAKRLEVLPELPTFAEAGLPGIEAYGWQGVFVPVGTPKAIVERLNAGIAWILHTPELRNQIIDGGSELGGGSAEEFAAFTRSERQKWGKVIQDAKITPE